MLTCSAFADSYTSYITPEEVMDALDSPRRVFECFFPVAATSEENAFFDAFFLSDFFSAARFASPAASARSRRFWSADSDALTGSYW